LNVCLHTDKNHELKWKLKLTLIDQTICKMKRILVSIKKKVEPSHKLIATEWVSDSDLDAIRKKYGNQFDPDDPIISFLSDQLLLVSFLVWIHE